MDSDAFDGKCLGGLAQKVRRSQSVLCIAKGTGLDAKPFNKWHPCTKLCDQQRWRASRTQGERKGAEEKRETRVLSTTRVAILSEIHVAAK